MSETPHGGSTSEGQPEPTAFQHYTDIFIQAFTAQEAGAAGVLAPAQADMKARLDAAGYDFHELCDILAESAASAAAVVLGGDPTLIESRAIAQADNTLKDYLTGRYPEQMGANGDLHLIIARAFQEQAEIANSTPDDWLIEDAPGWNGNPLPDSNDQ